MDTFKFEKSILNYIEKHILLFVFLAVTFFALCARVYALNWQSWDFTAFLLPWYKQITEMQGFKGLNLTITDYPVSYIYFLTIMTYFPKIDILWAIKFFSIFFDFVMAFTAMFIVNRINEKNKNAKFYSLFVYSLVLLAPTSILNSSVWGQCDSIYTAILLISLFFCMNKRYLLTFIFLGIACSFKVQTLFFIPVFIVIYIRTKEFSIINFFILPIVYLFLSIPAFISGNSISDVFAPFISYGKGTTSGLFYYLNNMYSILNNSGPELTEALIKIGAIITVIIIGISLFLFIYKKIEVNHVNILFLSLFIIVTITNFMPAMHERYLYPGDILSIIFFVANKDIKYICIPCVVNLVSFLSYFNYLAGQDLLWIVQIFTAFIYFFFFFYLCFIAYKMFLEQSDTNSN